MRSVGSVCDTCLVDGEVIVVEVVGRLGVGVGGPMHLARPVGFVDCCLVGVVPEGPEGDVVMESLPVLSKNFQVSGTTIKT